jgi:hypothetical protein
MVKALIRIMTSLVVRAIKPPATAQPWAAVQVAASPEL